MAPTASPLAPGNDDLHTSVADEGDIAPELPTPGHPLVFREEGPKLEEPLED